MTKQQLQHELMLAREEIHSLRHKLERYRSTVTRLENLLKDNGVDPNPPPVK